MDAAQRHAAKVQFIAGMQRGCSWREAAEAAGLQIGQQIPAAPVHARQNSTWRAFLRQHQHQLLACDFFTVETLRLQTLYVLFFLEIGTRRIFWQAAPPTQRLPG